MSPICRHFCLYSFLLALLVLCIGPTPAWTQSGSTGNVIGQVTDQQNAVIPGAEVTLLDTSTNSSRTTVTNEAGRYTFPNVPPGTYDITVGLAGFSTAKVSGQKVTVGETLTLNVTLRVGALSETVEVSAAAGAQLQTTNATVGSTIAGDSLMLLPNLARDASQLATLQVGVTPSGQVAGTAADQSTYQLDGGNNSDDLSGNQSYVPIVSGSSAPTGVVPTPVESIEEFKVGTSNQTADFNGSAGSQVQMVTKRGTNQLHGSLYEHYFGTNIGAANDWKNNHTPSKTLPYTPLPKSHKNRFGASAGGPLLPRDFMGGKWYIFGNYEGYRFPNSTTYEKPVPTALMRAGVIQIPTSSGVIAYNINPNPVTVNGVTYQPAKCGSGNTPCDPRGVGLNPVVSQVWSKYMPLPNDPQYGDLYNTQGYLTPINLPQTSNFFVARIDHDFGPKWHFMASYRYYKMNQVTSSQVDIGGVVSGATFGQAFPTSTRPAKPAYYVAGLTTTINPRLTNDFRFSYLRNFWEWTSVMAPPQLPGLGGAIEIGGETANALIPYNVNAGSVRTRDWNGQDKVVRDDFSWLHGNHMFQFGGYYQRNFVQHHRTDNIGYMTAMIYQINSGAGIAMSSTYQPAGLPSNQVSNWNTLYAEVLGLVNQSQALFTRSGPQLTLNPLGTPFFPQSVFPMYNVYASDTWHVRPKFTLTYGLGYLLEVPPVELKNQQVVLVNTAGNMINTADYLAQRRKAALAGQVYNPTLGFATTENVGGGIKYPWKTFYGGFSPRIAAAWNPAFGDGILGKIFGRNETVLRGGYSRILGRLNGVQHVMVPLLGVGAGQPVSCIGGSRNGQCLGNAGVDPTTAFRIGVDGLNAPLPAVTQTLPQPFYPGVGSNAPTGDMQDIDPYYRPNRSDQFTLSIQRALSPKLIIEAGYIGRIIRHENQAINLDAVPYMTTLGGQSFSQAYANLYTALSSGAAVQVQPFFEAAMGGASSAYCAKFASCTAAVAANLKSPILATQVFNVWSTLSKQTSSWTLGRTLPSSDPAQVTAQFLYSSLGYGNYNAGFFSFTARDWHGLGARSNFTWSRAFGTGSVNQSGNALTVADPFDLSVAYGPQPFDIRFMYNQTILYQPQWFRGQKGILGRVLGGWSIAPIFTAQSGAPIRVSVGSGTNVDCQSFGESSCNGNRANENAVLIVPYTGGNSANYNIAGSNGRGTSGDPAKGGSGINMFSDPNAIYGQFRRLVLGIDHNAGGAGRVRGFPSWNLDMTISKDFRATERIGATLMFQFVNVMNHFQPSNPTLNLDSPQTFGVVTSQGNTPRQMEFGLRIRF